MSATYGLVAVMLWGALKRAEAPAVVLLLAYWSLQLPQSGQDLALALRTFIPIRNTALRITEPLGAVEEGQAATVATSDQCGAVRLELAHVTVAAGGHQILEDLNLCVDPGSHVAIVGASGAGKSTLLGLFLGFHRPTSGEVRVDGALLDGDGLARLRRATAWVDPAVQLWNRSFLENLIFGAERAPSGGELTAVVQTLGLEGSLQRLPDGLASALGETGTNLSGGEGQRVRVARALLHKGARLVILDEAFRGFAKDERQTLLAQLRQRWKGATLLYVTHDATEAAAFDRVLVLEAGRIIEDGVGSELAKRRDSRLRVYLDAEAMRQRAFGGTAGFRNWQLLGGKLKDAVG
jgi:ATP-binding cassette subfamily B protein